MATFCSTSSIVMPSALMRRNAANRSCTTSGDRPSDGSSSNSSFGRDISARATATICCWPPDSDAAAAFSLAFNAGNNASACSSELERCARAPGSRLPSSRFSSTLMVANSRRPSGTMAMPSAQKRCGGSRVMSRPSN